MNDQPMFDVISGMFGLISGMFGLNRSSIEPGIRYSCYPLVVVFNILSWYRFHCRGMTKHLADFLRGVAFWSIRSVGLLR